MIWIILLSLLLLGILAAHLFGANLLRGSKLFQSVYFWPILTAVFAFGAWHIWKMRSFKSRGMRSGEEANDPDVVSYNGLHSHPEISIYVKGEKQEIPHMGISDMDMGAMHRMHTRMQHMHEGPNEQGVVHLKFQGVVRKGDITLGKFFKKWGKGMRSFGANMKMTVNGKESTEYENYVMQDKDKIELRYD